MKAFLDELRRRGVTRAAAMYAVAAWAVIEVSATVLPALHLPEWTVTLVVVLALLGFPLALVLAWLFDLTHAGIVRTPERDSLPPAQRPPLERGRAIEVLVIVLLLGVIAWLGWERLYGEAPVPESATVAADRLDSIAVLPFANLSGDPDNEYFGDGLAEELLNVLVRIEGLRVTARTSSFQYKGRNLDIRDIARDLGVSTVLEGSVRKAGERVRITAQLIRATDGFHLWSETFDRELADIFAVQDEIANAIARALQARLQVAEGENRGTRNVAAFEAYLRGRFAMNQRTGPALEQAVVEFRNAIALDPDYAAAFSGLADSYLLQADYGRLAKPEAIRLAKPVAQRALELGPDLAESHASVGLLLRDEGNTEASIAAFQRAIERNPSYSPAHHWLALSYQDLGRLREARMALEESLRIDPNYVTGKRVLLGLLRGTGAHEEADAFASRLAREHADDSVVLYTLSSDAVGRNRLVDAARLAADAVRLQPQAPFLRIQLANVLGLVGDLERADAQIEQARAAAPDQEFIRLWPLQRAVFATDLATLRNDRAALLEFIKDEGQRTLFDCAFASTSADAAIIVNACAPVFASDGWKQAAGMPRDLGGVVLALLFAHKTLGNDEPYALLRAGAEQELARLQREGLAKGQVAGFRAMLDWLDGGSVDAYLDALEAWIPQTPISVGMLENDLQYAGVREHPRFQALVQQRRQEMANARAEIAAMTLP